jgi:hypothetical protein
MTDQQTGAQWQSGGNRTLSVPGSGNGSFSGDF